jgi:hypothetical protein
MLDASETDRAFAEKRMREINEAWQVLQDTDRRKAYDDTLWTGGQRRERPPAPPPEPADMSDPFERGNDFLDLGPERQHRGGFVRMLPWLLVLVTLALIFVLTAYAGRNANKIPGDSPAAPRCVTVVPITVVTEVPCTGPHDLRIMTRVDAATPCPVGQIRRKLTNDGMFDCVVLN